MKPDPELEALLAQYIEREAADGQGPSPESMCEGRPHLAAQLAALVKAYREISTNLKAGAEIVRARASLAVSDLPQIEGFRTVERLGRGGMGEVYKLRDLKLDRVVAGKIVRRDRVAVAALRDFLGEARAMALFRDRRVVQIHEFRDDQDPPVIIMEFVDGFELGEVASSLEYHQRARILEQVAEAIHEAHVLGIQHRDLKPSNIMLDRALSPKIMDFGLSMGAADRGHLLGTLPYMAPEQLDPSRPIDPRTDVHALGVILYQMLCGVVPYEGPDEEALIAAIRRGEPRLPIEIEPSVPEPLQAIALKAMEKDPVSRYQSARDMALDVRRYLDGRPVLARPAAYATALEARVKPHLEHIGEWLRLRLIYPHEAGSLRAAYQSLEARDDDWILASRVLSYSQIALYLGAFFLLAGSLFYFNNYVEKVVTGFGGPLLVLGVPFVGLNAVAHRLYRRERRAVAVAFYLGGVALLPLLLLIILRENHMFAAATGAGGQIFDDGYLSNRQLQITMAAACAWALVLAFRTRTAALSTVFTALLFVMALAVLSDFGLRSWVEALDYHLIASHIAPLAVLYAAAGVAAERSGRPWFARSLYVAAALVMILALELMAQNGKLFAYLGIHMQLFQVQGPAESELGNTLVAMTLNGVVMYVVALLVEQRGSDAMRRAGGLLFTLAPFAALKPLGYLSMTGFYLRSFDWIYLVLSVGSCLLAHHSQRRAFYVAGLMNTAWALYEIAEHNGWIDEPAWAAAVVAAGLVVLAAGYSLNVFERNRRRPL